MSQLILNSNQIQKFIKTRSQFQARSENVKTQNLNFKHDPSFLNTKSQLRARLKNDKKPSLSCQGGQNTASELKSILILK